MNTMDILTEILTYDIALNIIEKKQTLENTRHTLEKTLLTNY